MTINTESHISATDKATLDLQEKLDRLLAKAKLSKREQVQKNFRGLFPKLEEHIWQGKPLKEVLAAFNTLTQSNACLRTFNDMLAKERERRSKADDPVRCHACGKPLEVRAADEFTATGSDAPESNPPSSNSLEQE